MPRRRQKRSSHRRPPQSPSPPRSIVDSDAESISADSAVLDDYISNILQQQQESSTDSLPQFSSPASPQDLQYTTSPDNIPVVGAEIYEACKSKQTTFLCKPASSKVRLGHHRIAELLGAQSQSSGDDPNRWVEITFTNVTLPDRDYFLKRVREIEIELGLGKKKKKRNKSFGQKKSVQRTLRKLEKVAQRYIEQMVREGLIDTEQANEALNMIDWQNEQAKLNDLTEPRQRDYIRKRVLKILDIQLPQQEANSLLRSFLNDSIGRRSDVENNGTGRAIFGKDATMRTKSLVDQNPIGEDNWGYAMLQKMGWKEGTGLGADGSGIVQPFQVEKRNSRSGLG